MRGCITAVLLVSFALLSGCSSSSSSHVQHVTLMPDKVQWGGAPPGLPPGVQSAALEGDPAMPGHFTVRAKMPDGYRIPPHWHSSAEQITVISGIFNMGTGDHFNLNSADTLSAGAYSMMPPHMTHYAWTKGETIIQVSGEGPFDIHYVNAADDPRGMNP